jgi:hypothetical protein
VSEVSEPINTLGLDRGSLLKWYRDMETARRDVDITIGDGGNLEAYRRVPWAVVGVRRGVEARRLRWDESIVLEGPINEVR